MTETLGVVGGGRGGPPPPTTHLGLLYEAFQLLNYAVGRYATGLLESPHVPPSAPQSSSKSQIPAVEVPESTDS